MKGRSLAVWTILAAVAAVAGVFFRFYPLTVYPFYEARNTAEILVYSNVQKNLAKTLREKYPSATAARLEGLKQDALRRFAAEKGRFRGLVDRAAAELRKNRREDPGRPYLMEVDPFYYLGLTRRLVDKEPALPVRGREYRNPLMLAPAGAWYPVDFHPYTGLWTYRALSLFVRGIPLEKAVGFVPLVLAALCVIPFFRIGAVTFSLGRTACFLGALFLLLAPVFLRRSLWGWYDTDPYNVLFPLAVLACLFGHLTAEEGRAKKFWLLGAVAAVSAYSLFWRGWLLAHTLVALSFTAALLSKPRRGKTEIAGAFLFATGPFLAGLALWGPTGLSELFGEAVRMPAEFLHPSFDVWPDAFLTVGELRSGGVMAAAKALGGPCLILAALGAIFAVGERKDASRAPAVLTATLLALSVALAAKIERFALLAVAPAAIGLALGAQAVLGMKRAGSALKAAFAALLGAWILFSAHTTARYEHPIYNGTWDKALAYVRQETPPDSIVTSWWCPGHYISAMGRRRVTFDGATQNTPQVYWVANLFLERDENKAASILRMLDLSADGAVELLTGSSAGRSLKISEAVTLLHGILPLSREDAERALKDLGYGPQSARLLDLTHGEPPPGYVLVYNDMVDQAMALEYTGKRDLARAELLKEEAEKDPKIKIPGRASRENVALAWKLSEGPYAQDAESYETGRAGGLVRFSNGLVADPERLEARLTSKKFPGQDWPKYLYAMKDGRLEKKSLGEAGVSALLIRDENAEGKASYRSVLADERLIESLLFRLYYLKGEGLERFEPAVSAENAADRTKIYLYRVRWR